MWLEFNLHNPEFKLNFIIFYIMNWLEFASVFDTFSNNLNLRRTKDLKKLFVLIFDGYGVSGFYFSESYFYIWILILKSRYQCRLLSLWHLMEDWYNSEAVRCSILTVGFHFSLIIIIINIPPPTVKDTFSVKPTPADTDSIGTDRGIRLSSLTNDHSLELLQKQTFFIYFTRTTLA